VAPSIPTLAQRIFAMISLPFHTAPQHQFLLVKSTQHGLILVNAEPFHETRESRYFQRTPSAVGGSEQTIFVRD